jgi:predicted ATPase/class 3 adenylate cyclase
MAGVVTRTFLFSDIEGSTRLLRRLGDDYAGVLDDHRHRLRTAFKAHHGDERGTEGDSFFVVFERAGDAISAAIDGQLALRESGVRVRMGIHTGEALEVGDDLIGLAIHEAARVMASANGGQIVASEATRLLAGAFPSTTDFRDLGAHELKDFEAPVRLYQVCHTGLPSEFPPLRTLSMRPNNLPSEVTSFVGREGEVDDVANLLSTARLVTLTGTGGIGKTRLSRQVAAAIAERFPDGVWMVELAAVSDAANLASVVAAAVRLRMEPDQPPIDALVEWCRGKRALVLLDNCEHLIAECAELVHQLLSQSEHLRVLATSREPLGITGESRWTVDPLSSGDAVQLFVERARAVRADFAAEVADIETITSRLDGIPLAIELAASRVGALPLRDLAARLDDRFRLLTGGSRAALPRHQTLRAAMDWSHDLLSEGERVLLRRLAVFAGPFDLDAAEVVTDVNDAIDDLTRLVDRSLVRFTQSGYALLQTVRDYAAEQLAAAAEDTAFRARHLEWCLALAQDAAPHLQGRQQREWLMRLDAAADDINSAITWGLGAGRAGDAARLASLLHRFWFVRGRWDEGRTWLEELIPHAPDDEVRVRLLNGVAAFMAVQADFAGATKRCEEALGIAPSADAHFTLGVVAIQRGFIPEARDQFVRALRLHREAGDESGAAAALSNLANVAWASADSTTARRLLDEALEIQRRLGDDHGTAVCLNNLAVLAMADDVDRARSLSEESLRLSRILDDTEGQASALDNLAEALETQGDLEAAKTMAEESLVLGLQLGDRHGVALTRTTLGRILRSLGDEDGAKASLHEAMVTQVDLGDRHGLVTTLIVLGDPELLGLASTLVEEGSPQVEELEAAVARVRAAIGAGFDPAYAAGQSMEVDDLRLRAPTGQPPHQH